MKINKYVSIVTAMLILSMFAGVAVSSEVRKTVEQVSGPAMPVVDQPGNFTKLEISPRYSNFRLQPGESKEITVTIRNKENKAVSVKPNIVIPPYGEYMMDKGWIKVTPDSAEIPAGGSQKFTVKASISKDASIGYYNAQIAFTNETIPTPYPEPFPNYVHSFSLSIDVWTPPKIQIMPRYISDQLEAGKEYDYQIKLKNIGDKEIGINPMLGSDVIGGPYGTMPPALTEDAITITAPKSIPANTTEIVKIHVKVPGDAKGYYHGWIDLGIDDPSVPEYEGRVNLDFNIWKQPTEPFVKNFSLKEDAPITIEISSGYLGMYPWMWTKNTKEPSFETTLEGPEGRAKLEVSKKVIKGAVSLGGDIPPWEIDSTGIYQEMGTQYTETYTTDGEAGKYKLSVLPRNTQGFEYSIKIGEGEE